jgi:hypothetical protein
MTNDGRLGGTPTDKPCQQCGSLDDNLELDLKAWGLKVVLCTACLQQQVDAVGTLVRAVDGAQRQKKNRLN